MRALEVRESSQVAEARREAVKLARSHGFDEEAAGRVAIVVTELATNLINHGGGGELLLGSYEDDTGAGVECLALDRGAGMQDVAAAMTDGHSTAGSSGTGLGAARRGSDTFELFSAAGLGTAILVRMSASAKPKAGERAHPSFGAVSVPMAGEVACGDGWCRQVTPHGVAVMVSDGLGHGESAATATLTAIRSFADDVVRTPAQALAAMHGAMRHTRGAAVGVAQLDWRSNAIVFCGIGNIAATVVQPSGDVQRMVSSNGTVGHVAKSFKEFTYPLEHDPLIVLASDGLATSWRLDSYPGLFGRHPTLIAGVLYRDFSRRRDDVTVLVARGSRP